MSSEDEKLIDDFTKRSSSFGEIAKLEDNADEAVDAKTKDLRNTVAFWIFGLTNNFGYVVMLSSAFDILAEQRGQVQEKRKSGFHCNAKSTGVILLADILPTLIIKWTAPWYMQALGYHLRILLIVLFSISSFLTVAFSQSEAVSVLGVVFASLSSGFGEPTFLSLSSQYTKNTVSSWSSGTGAAGLFGALAYAGLISIGVSPKTTLLVMNASPVAMALSFWFLLESPDQTPSITHVGRTVLIRGKRDDKTANLTLMQKVHLIKPLLRYIIPLFTVYVAEYIINQGLFELIYYPNTFLDQAEQYRWFQADYQLGVLISRSSVNLIKINSIEILSALQYVNFIVLLLEVYFRFIPSIWITLGIIFFEGLLGGGVYVNAFYRVTTEVSEDVKEFSMGVTSTGDSTGITLAALLSMPLHSYLCKYSKKP